ncbi:MAG: outer membrane lipid asymmetry maintenance protein MlaD [Alphaproteobacteria bacterium]|jgi:phospholipid/cholesterol/gamma-HCH transport system substrate-binding protein|nr:outer membrane lipid asymmetry maintenance protein MlaD [Alphaproteobacteria bacterium]MDP6255181.1 outer membrane lipid asymmetry maintenance protein MlaD [Alphaproteobacteria bacterium]MDP7052601.1 outer membrane lipid asymmetry maintenance protein MlaD [Alphaproteobacteria bacterium]MDP7229718.1 outer membrane lipid asymmetry maintenance protein MlaD [Alphaproteobacteria bacterium]MDP7458974.1 outer membrane lipid asymmetry maintenance protein MlaD [Alphaproteobacteria bacterium]|tara:strand:+ start:4589 stop:5044 length:456 start_codon:yes stop_codon:yes gene_type:complete
MSGNVVETLIGAVVLVVAGFFLYFSYDKADVGMVEGYSLTAKFDKVDGVKVGSDVMLAGIKVGTVTDESLDTKEYLAVLQLSLASDVQLPDDSVIKIASDGLLGGKYLSIDPGGSEDYLEAGDEIRFTQGAVDLTELIGKAIYSGGGKPTQ